MQREGCHRLWVRSVCGGMEGVLSLHATKHDLQNERRTNRRELKKKKKKNVGRTVQPQGPSRLERCRGPPTHAHTLQPVHLRYYGFSLVGR